MVLLLWQALAVLNGSLQFYNPKLFPAPSDIAVAGWTLIQTGDLQRDIAVSVGRVVVGFAIAAPLAIVLGVLVAKVRWCETLLDPVVEALRPVPTLALLPIIILWFGIGETSKVFFIGYSCFFVIVAAEIIAADTGLGYLINYSRTWFQVDNMMLGAIIIGALGITSNYVLVAIERRLFRWRATGG